MELTSSERAVLGRYAEKCRAAGGPRVGFVLRRRAILAAGGEAGLESGLGSLVERGLLAPGENTEFLFLTESGCEALGTLAS